MKTIGKPPKRKDGDISAALELYEHDREIFRIRCHAIDEGRIDDDDFLQRIDQAGPERRAELARVIQASAFQMLQFSNRIARWK